MVKLTTHLFCCSLKIFLRPTFLISLLNYVTVKDIRIDALDFMFLVIIFLSYYAMELSLASEERLYFAIYVLYDILILCDLPKPVFWRDLREFFFDFSVSFLFLIDLNLSLLLYSIVFGKAN